MAVPYFGDFAEDATVYIPFNTFSSDDPSASVTITNLVNTDIHIHKDGGTTQRNNAAGITMSVDYDSITGNHLVTIDTSDDTVAGFWTAGHEYQVRMEGTTVDGATVNAWIGAFSIERSGGVLALLKNGTYGLSALETLVDGVESGLTTIEGKIDTIDGIVDDILVDTGTTIPGTITTIDGIVDDILVDTGTTLSGTLSTIEGKIDTIDGIVDSILEDTGTTIPGTLTTIDGIVDDILVATGTTLPSTLSSLDSKIDTIDGIVDAIVADTGTDGVVVAAGSKTGYSLAADQSAVTIGTVNAATLTGDLTATMKASVNAEVLDVLATDTISELSQGVPAATPTVFTAIMLLYMKERNKTTVTSSELGIYNDAGTKIAKADLSDNGTTYTKDELASGA